MAKGTILNVSEHLLSGYGRDKAIFNFLWYSGTRLSETANIKASDFDWIVNERVI
jgi:integrase